MTGAARTMLAAIANIYRSSKKRKDINAFTQYVARPPAAAIVWLLQGTPITPNQVTLFATVVCAAAGALLVGWLSWLGLVVAIAVFELSFVLDCVDGMLARLRKIASPLGHLLDFLMDELKAYLLVAGISLRWFLQTDAGVYPVLLGLGTLVIIGSALSLTKFVRTPEYAQATGTKQLQHGEAAGASRQRSGPLWPVQLVARLISQYPATLPLFAVADRLDLFLYAYAGVHVLYIGQTTLVVLWRLGRFAPRAAPSVAPRSAPESTP